MKRIRQFLRTFLNKKLKYIDLDSISLVLKSQVPSKCSIILTYIRNVQNLEIRIK